MLLFAFFGLLVLTFIFFSLWHQRSEIDLKSRIFKCFTRHTRFQPIKHGFRYELFFFCLNLDELDALSQAFPLFGHNKWRPFAIHDLDYMGRAPEDLGLSIKQKLLKYLALQKCEKGIDVVELLTGPRYFGYAFNPVNFYYCYTNQGTDLKLIVAEVNNTFGETYLYILNEEVRKDRTRNGYLTSYLIPRSFHVSPFNDRTGDYEIHCSEISERLDVHFVVYKEEKKHMMAQLTSTENSIPFNFQNLWKVILFFPFSAFLTVPRILWEAGKLSFMKKLPVFSKPNPKGFTITCNDPDKCESYYLKIVSNYLKTICLQKGMRLIISLPTFQKNKTLEFGPNDAKHEITVKLNNFSLITSLATSSNLAQVAGSYMDGSWEASDLAAFLALLFQGNGNWYELDRMDLLAKSLWTLRNRGKPEHHDQQSITLDQLKGDVEGLCAQYALPLKEMKSGNILVIGEQPDLELFTRSVQSFQSCLAITYVSSEEEISKITGNFEHIFVMEGKFFPTNQVCQKALDSLIAGGKSYFQFKVYPIKSPCPELMVFDTLPLDLIFGSLSEKIFHGLTMFYNITSQKMEENYFSNITKYVIDPWKLLVRHYQYLNLLPSFLQFMDPCKDPLRPKISSLLKDWNNYNIQLSEIPILQVTNEEEKLLDELVYQQAEFARLAKFYYALHCAFFGGLPVCVVYLKPREIVK